MAAEWQQITLQRTLETVLYTLPLAKCMLQRLLLTNMRLEWLESMHRAHTTGGKSGASKQ